LPPLAARDGTDHPRAARRRSCDVALRGDWPLTPGAGGSTLPRSGTHRVATRSSLGLLSLPVVTFIRPMTSCLWGRRRLDLDDRRACVKSVSGLVHFLASYRSCDIDVVTNGRLRSNRQSDHQQRHKQAGATEAFVIPRPYHLVESSPRPRRRY
jgi:hypothetical protein